MLEGKHAEVPVRYHHHNYPETKSTMTPSHKCMTHLCPQFHTPKVYEFQKMGTACRRCRLKHIQHRNNRREKRKEKKMFKAKRAESKREICPPFANPTTNKRKKRIPDGIKNKTGECHQRLTVAVITRLRKSRPKKEKTTRLRVRCKPRV